MSHSLGLDHALVCVNDIHKVRDTYMQLGFLNRGISQHPWGTSTTVIIFRDQLFEIVSIGDASLLDSYETGGFYFGRHIERYLKKREGVCLTALNSSNAHEDAMGLEARGIAVTGTIDFGREVTDEQGYIQRTKTQLKVLYNATYPRLSLFACQQFRRDLIEYPQWMKHPNGVEGIRGFTILCNKIDREDVTAWLEKVHGATAAHGLAANRVETANGVWTVTTAEGFESMYGEAPKAMDADALPMIIGIDLITATPEKVAEAASALDIPCCWKDGLLTLQDPAALGGVYLRLGHFETANQSQPTLS